MKFRMFALLLAILAASGTRAEAQQIIGIDLFDGKIHSINIRTGAAGLLCDTGLDQWLWSSLAIDSHGSLYGAYGDTVSFSGTSIYRIDPQSGSSTSSFTFQCRRSLACRLAFKTCCSSQVTAFHSWAIAQ